MSQTAEIRFDYVLGGDGLAAVNRLTGEVLKLAAAEDTALGRAKALGQETAKVGTGGPAAGGSPPRFGPEAPKAPAGPGTARANPLLDDAFGLTPRQRTDATAFRRTTTDAQCERLTSAPRPGPRPEDERKRQDTQLVRAIENLASAISRLTAGKGTEMPPAPGTPAGIRAETAMREGRKVGMMEWIDRGDAAKEFEDQLRVKRAEDAERRRVRDGLAGGFATGAGAMAITAARAASHASNIPFADEETKKWEYFRQFQIPVLNVGVSDLRDFQQHLQRLGKGLSQDEQKRFLLEEESRTPVFDRPREEHAARQWFGQRDADRRMLASVGYDREVPEPGNPLGKKVNALPPFAFTERETVDTQYRRAEERGRTPAADRLILARREEVVARGRLDDFDRHIERLQGNMTAAAEAANQFRIQAEGHPNDDGGFGRQRLYAQSRAQEERAAMFGELLMKSRDEQQQARFDLVRARGGVREADLGLRRVELGQLREREDTARSQAMTLAYAGPAGRAQGEFAMQLIQEAGVANAPAEILAMARPFYGKTLDKMAEQEGQQFVPQFRSQAPGEYRDTVPDIARQVDQLEQTVRDREQRDLPNQFLQLFKAFNDVAVRDNDLLKQLERVVKQIEADLRLMNNQPK